MVLGALASPVDKDACLAECSRAYDSCRDNCKGLDAGLSMMKICRDIFYKCIMDCDKLWREMIHDVDDEEKRFVYGMGNRFDL